MSILTESDFTGIIRIDKSTHNSLGTLEDFLNYWEKSILLDLLGHHLYLDFINNLTKSKYITFLAGETLSIDSENWKFEGVKYMLKYLIAFYLKRENENQFDHNKVYLEPPGEKLKRMLVLIWNQGIDYYNDCIYYINYKNSLISETFPNFEYKTKEKINLIFY